MNRLANRLSSLGLLVLFLAGLYYLTVEVVRLNPTADKFTVTLHLPQSGGLLTRSEVTYRGVPVGQVIGIRLRPDGVAVDLHLNEGTRIPRDSAVRVAGLSVAGEQYVDVRPRSDGGPYLANGAVIDDAQTPTHFATLLANITELADQVDPEKIRLIFDELSTAVTGTDQHLRTIVSGSDRLLADLQDVLPETVRILRNGRTTLDTVVELRDELRRLGTSAPVVARELKAADPQLRSLLDQSPETLRLVDALLVEIEPEVEALLHDIDGVGQVLSPRTGALSVLFPELQRAGQAMSTLGGDRLNVLIDLWPRVGCPYGTKERPPTEAGWPKPRLDAYCPLAHPELQQRGAYNAPRPANDPTRTDQTPAAQPQPRAVRTGEWFRDYLTFLDVAP